MAAVIRLSDDLVADAKLFAKAQHRTPSQQVEHWARLGKVAEENPDLPLSFINGVLVGLEEVKAGKLSEYTFG